MALREHPRTTGEMRPVLGWSLNRLLEENYVDHCNRVQSENRPIGDVERFIAKNWFTQLWGLLRYPSP